MAENTDNLNTLITNLDLTQNPHNNIFPQLRQALSNKQAFSDELTRHPAATFQELHRLWNTTTELCKQLATTQNKAKQDTDSLHLTIQELHEEYESLKTQTNIEKATYEAIIRGTPTATAAPRLSPQHPDPEIFSGETPALLPRFLKSMQHKLVMNADWYDTEEKRMIYFSSRLCGKAHDQIDGGFQDGGVIKFKDVEEIATLLRRAFGDVDETSTAQAKLLEMAQGHQPLVTFLPTWQALALKTGFDDTALIAILRKALHKEILNRLSFISPDNIPKDLDGFLTQVRTLDSTLRQIDPQYEKKGKHRSSTTAITTTAFSPNVPTTIATPMTSGPTSPQPVDDPMEISLVWIPAPGKRPKTTQEKAAHRRYCFDNDLCLLCDSPKHKIADCPHSHVNKKKAEKGKAALVNEAVVEEGKV